MPPIRKSFPNDAPFPFDLVYKDTKSPRRELPNHLHDRYEMVYVHGGKGTFFIDRTFYEMKRGDLVVILDNTIHRAFPDPDDPVTSTAVFFSPALALADSLGDAYSGLRCFEDARKRSYKIEIEAFDAWRNRLETVLNVIHAELAGENAGYRHAVRLLLQQLLLGLNCLSVPQSAGNTASVDTIVGPLWIRDAQFHIDRNGDRPLSLSFLAGRASVSPAHFSRVFKRFTGMNITDYVHAKRIVRAKEILMETDESVEGSSNGADSRVCLIFTGYSRK